jgi:hypothetical protein
MDTFLTGEARIVPLDLADQLVEAADDDVVGFVGRHGVLEEESELTVLLASHHLADATPPADGLLNRGACAVGGKEELAMARRIGPGNAGGRLSAGAAAPEHFGSYGVLVLKEDDPPLLFVGAGRRAPPFGSSAAAASTADFPTGFCLVLIVI